MIVLGHPRGRFAQVRRHKPHWKDVPQHQWNGVPKGESYGCLFSRSSRREKARELASEREKEGRKEGMDVVFIGALAKSRLLIPRRCDVPIGRGLV
jgi:hypothetical protein